MASFSGETGKEDGVTFLSGEIEGVDQEEDQEEEELEMISNSSSTSGDRGLLPRQLKRFCRGKENE